MQEKTIKTVIHKKINDWMDSLQDYLTEKTSKEEAIKTVKDIRKNIIVTGGSIPSLMENQTPKDYDVYFRDKETVLKVAQIYVDMWNEDHEHQHNNISYKTKVFVLDGENPSHELLNYYNISKLSESKSRMIANTQPDRVKIIFPSDGIVGNPEEANASEELGSPVDNISEVDETEAEEIIAKEKRKYYPVFISTNAITLSNGIQIVVRFYGEPSKIHETYDFEHTKAYYYAGELNIPTKVYETVMNKVLIYTGSRYPVCSLFRMRKFIARGWTINAGQILKMAMQISDLDLSDIDVLEDQLIGVDSLYFMHLIEQFRRQKENNPNFTLTSSYVMSIIDKIF